MQRSRQLRLKTRRSFSPAWSLNFPKGSMRLRLMFTRRSPARDAGFDEDMAVGPHPFAVACRARGITHLRSYRPPMKPLAPKVRSTGVEIRSGAVRPM